MARKQWCEPLVSALGRQKQADLCFCEFEASLVYRLFQDKLRGYTEKPCLEKKEIKFYKFANIGLVR